MLVLIVAGNRCDLALAIVRQTNGPTEGRYSLLPTQYGDQKLLYRAVAYVESCLQEAVRGGHQCLQVPRGLPEEEVRGNQRRLCDCRGDHQGEL